MSNPLRLEQPKKGHLSSHFAQHWHVSNAHSPVSASFLPLRSTQKARANLINFTSALRLQELIELRNYCITFMCHFDNDTWRCLSARRRSKHRFEPSLKLNQSGTTWNNRFFYRIIFKRKRRIFFQFNNGIIFYLKYLRTEKNSLPFALVRNHLLKNRQSASATH